MQRGLKIRAPTEGDIDQLEPLLQELIGEPAGDRKKKLCEALDHDNYFAFVAEDGMNIVGFVDLWVLPDPGHGAQMAYLTSLIVHRARRRGGIGCTLIEAVIEAARKNGAVEVHVTTKMDNEPAKRLYKSCGFTKQHTTLELEMVSPDVPGPME